MSFRVPFRKTPERGIVATMGLDFARPLGIGNKPSPPQLAQARLTRRRASASPGDAFLGALPISYDGVLVTAMSLRAWIPLVAIVTLTATTLRAGLLDEVPASSRDELAAGQVVVKSKNVQGAPWPQLSLYQVIDAPPDVVRSLLLDYNAAPSYTPGMLGAKVVANNPDGTRDVQYTVKVPVLQKISYTVRNTYTQKGKNFGVSWTLLQSPLAKSVDGSLRIEPYGDDQTLMCYTNLVVPITNLVAGLKNQALTEAKATVLAIKTEAEKRAAAKN